MRKNVLSLVFDGLHLGFLGMYGNSWVATPMFDELACESILFDRYYTNALELSAIYDEFWSNGLIPQLKEKGYRTILVTDEPELANGIGAELFDEVCFFDEHIPEKPAETVEQTRFYRFLAVINELASQSTASQNTNPYFLWGHWSGLRKIWDGPLELRKEYVEEGDPDPFPGIVPPLFDLRGEDEDNDIDPDELQSVIAAYSGEISIVDTAFAGLHESLKSGELGENTLFLLTATRGFPLGEHRLIGIPSDQALLWAENVHLPLVLRFPDQRERMTRTAIFTQPGNVCTILAEWCGMEPGQPNSLLTVHPEEAESRPDCKSLENKLYIQGELGEIGIVTSDWFFKKKGSKVELYVKPDDRWEISEVADRCSETVEEFLKMLADDAESGSSS